MLPNTLSLPRLLSLNKPLPSLTLCAALFMTGHVSAAQRERSTAGNYPTGNASQALPDTTKQMLKDLWANASRSADAAELVSQAHQLAHQGNMLLDAGNKAAAAEKFAKARGLLLSSDEQTFYQPAVHAYFLELANDVSFSVEPPHPSLGSTAGLWKDNPRVVAFVRYYQGRGRDQLQSALRRLAQYQSLMRPTFIRAGVPVDLIYVGLVESAYNPYAESPAGAKGIWQFIPGTGARYGLHKTSSGDDREDPEKSTLAAARYLRDLHAMFGDWLLALAAYNAGEYRILNVMRKTGVRDFWTMAERRLIPPETANYVPAVLAAVQVVKRGAQARTRLDSDQSGKSEQ